MIAAGVVFVYLAIVLYVGVFAFRGKSTGKEEFFVANRSLGTFVFLLSLFGSNMTSFAILGSSGLAFRQGIGVYGLMASISGIVIPMSIFLIGTRLWSIGKRFGHITQVQILRDRFEMGHIGTVVFVLQAVMLVPYIIIGVMGGGETLEGVSGGAVPYWFGGLIVAAVVMGYVFFGGMRGTAWVNTVQTLMFLVFGGIAFLIIARGMGGLGATIQAMVGTLEKAKDMPVEAGKPSPVLTSDGALLTRDRIPFWYFASYAFIPLSSIMFPHIAIFCLTAKKLASFRKTVIFYPLCIMAIWLPSVFLGAVAGGRVEVTAALAAKNPSFAQFEQKFPVAASTVKRLVAGEIKADDPAALALWKPPVKPELRRLASENADGAMLEMLTIYSPTILAGLLGAAIMACVMASDSQILALSTMFGEDVFAFYGGRRRYGERAEVWAARCFVVLAAVAAYVIALVVHQHANIFEIAIQFAFSGYASMAPIMLACLFWRRATKWGVLASTLWVAACLVGFGVLQARTTPPASATAPPIPIWKIGDTVILVREYVRISFTEARVLLVAPMFIGSAVLMVVFSLLTRPPSAQTLERYFPRGGAIPATPAD